MLSLENFKSFGFAIDNCNRLHNKIMRDLNEYNLILQESADLLERILAQTKEEKLELENMILLGEEKIKNRKAEKIKNFPESAQPWKG